MTQEKIITYAPDKNGELHPIDSNESIEDGELYSEPQEEYESYEVTKNNSDLGNQHQNHVIEVVEGLNYGLKLLNKLISGI